MPIADELMKITDNVNIAGTYTASLVSGVQPVVRTNVLGADLFGHIIDTEVDHRPAAQQWTVCTP